MAITISLYNGITSSLGVYGAIQKTNTLGEDTRSSLEATLHSVDVASFNAANPAGVTDNELATGNGYTVGGKVLQNLRFTYTAGVLALFADDVTWTASGAGFTAKSALLRYRYPAASGIEALALIDFDMTSTISAGASLTLQWPSAGIFKWDLA